MRKKALKCVSVIDGNAMLYQPLSTVVVPLNFYMIFRPKRADPVIIFTDRGTYICDDLYSTASPTWRLVQSDSEEFPKESK